MKSRTLRSLTPNIAVHTMRRIHVEICSNRWNLPKESANNFYKENLMGENVKVLKVATKPDQLKVAADYVWQLCTNKITLKVDKYDDNCIKKITDFMTKTKKNAEFCMSFDGEWASFFARVGSSKLPNTAEKIAEFPNSDKVLAGLASYGIATPGQVAEFKKKHPPKP